MTTFRTGRPSVDDEVVMSLVHEGGFRAHVLLDSIRIYLTSRYVEIWSYLTCFWQSYGVRIPILLAQQTVALSQRNSGRTEVHTDFTTQFCALTILYPTFTSF